MRVRVEIDEEQLEGDYGNWIDGLCLRCTRCGHEVSVFGTASESAKAGAIMLRDECPNGETNFYNVSHWDG
jgi:hypothetical protein